MVLQALREEDEEAAGRRRWSSRTGTLVGATGSSTGHGRDDEAPTRGEKGSGAMVAGGRTEARRGAGFGRLRAAAASSAPIQFWIGEGGGRGGVERLLVGGSGVRVTGVGEVAL